MEIYLSVGKNICKSKDEFRDHCSCKEWYGCKFLCYKMEQKGQIQIQIQMIPEKVGWLSKSFVF